MVVTVKMIKDELEHREAQMAIYRALPWYQRAYVVMRWRAHTVVSILLFARNRYALRYHRRKRGEAYPLIDLSRDSKPVIDLRDLGRVARDLLWVIFRQPYEGEGATWGKDD